GRLQQGGPPAPSHGAPQPWARPGRRRLERVDRRRRGPRRRRWDGEGPADPPTTVAGQPPRPGPRAAPGAAPGGAPRPPPHRGPAPRRARAIARRGAGPPAGSRSTPGAVGAAPAAPVSPALASPTAPPPTPAPPP